jgi:hypothetical protein
VPWCRLRRRRRQSGQPARDNVESRWISWEVGSLIHNAVEQRSGIESVGCMNSVRTGVGAKHGPGS